MFKYIPILFIIGFVAAVPISPKDDKDIIGIIKSESNQQSDGSYNFAFESSDGNFRQETAEIIHPGAADESIKITGSYKYTDINGDQVLVNYTADENGFVPYGTIIAKEITDTAVAAKDLPKFKSPEEKDTKTNA